MKKLLYLVLAVVMILPLAVACGGNTPEGNPVEFSNVKVYSFKEAYALAETGAAVNPQIDDATFIYGSVDAGALVTAYVKEGEKATLGDVVKGYDYDQDGSAVQNDNGKYIKLAGLAEGDGFFWYFKVNGKEVSLESAVNPTDTIEIIYGK